MDISASSETDVWTPLFEDDEIEKYRDPHRDSLASHLTTVITPDDKTIVFGRMYFEHHGRQSSPYTGCSAKKVYDWLIQLGALPAPEVPEDRLAQMPTDAYLSVIKSERNRGVRIKHLVDFVDAQDNKNYYPDRNSGEQFDINQTLTNAFGLMNARVTDERGEINPKDWWGNYKLGSGYREEFMRLMMLTGSNYKRQFTLKQLEQVVGMKHPEKVLKRLRLDVAKAQAKIEEWEKAGDIRPTPGGDKVFTDKRKWQPERGSTEPDPLKIMGIDPTDILMVNGVTGRIIMGLDAAGSLSSVTAFAHGNPWLLKQFREMQRKRGGEILRNSMYVWNKEENK
jgi:hypothetical protein